MTTDGTVADTHRLREVGEQSFDMVGVGGTLFLSVEDAGSGGELWTSDGTLAGTTLFADLAPGAASSQPFQLTDGNGELWFTTADGSLWTSDGTPAGTVNVGTPPSTIDNIRALGSKLFFRASDFCHGRELWMSDGVASGVRRATDINPGPGDSDPWQPVMVGSRLFFTAIGPEGAEPWAWDGGTPPVDVCGNGAIDAGESCDEGDGNGTGASCCECGCTLTPVATECAASTGTCDAPEVCDGVSGSCPAPVVLDCGNGVLDPGEQCDLGALNGAFYESCCNCDCTISPASMSCRYSLGVCDPEEFCTGSSADCPADISQPDTDYDGVCDPEDLCLNPAGTIGSAEIKLDDPHGKGQIKGVLFVSGPVVVDPAAGGMQVVMREQGYNVPFFQVAIPSGARDPATHIGWKTSSSGKSWSYQNPHGPGGITRVTVKTEGPGLFSFRVTIKGGSFVPTGVTGIPVPLVMTLAVGAGGAAGDPCADVLFPSTNCRGGGTVPTLACRI